MASSLTRKGALPERRHPTAADPTAEDQGRARKALLRLLTARPEPQATQDEARKATRTGKVASNAPLVSLSRTIAGIVRNAAASSPVFRGLPSDAHAVNAEARDNAGRVTLESLAAWAWNRGVAVVPMAGRGEFSAAVWDDSPQPVIVLKESRELAIYWLFDLAHELAHLALGHVGQAALIDVESPAPRGDSSDSAEQAANDFALEGRVRRGGV